MKHTYAILLILLAPILFISASRDKKDHTPRKTVPPQMEAEIFTNEIARQDRSALRAAWKSQTDLEATMVGVGALGK